MFEGATLKSAFVALHQPQVVIILSLSSVFIFVTVYVLIHHSPTQTLVETDIPYIWRLITTWPTGPWSGPAKPKSQQEIKAEMLEAYSVAAFQSAKSTAELNSYSTYDEIGATEMFVESLIEEYVHKNYSVHSLLSKIKTNLENLENNNIENNNNIIDDWFGCDITPNDTSLDDIFFGLIPYFNKNLPSIDILLIPYAGQITFLYPNSNIMHAINHLHNDIMVYIIIIVTFVIGILFIICIIFRVDSFNIVRYKFTDHVKVEIAWTIIPSVLLICVSIPSFRLIYLLDARYASDFMFTIIGNQWFWIYIQNFEKNPKIASIFKHYSDEIEIYMINIGDIVVGQIRLLSTDNVLIVPVRCIVKFHVTSNDVLHSFAVPALGMKIDACPGRINSITVFINHTGVHYGQCSELCGIGHAFMPITLVSKTVGTIPIIPEITN